jgi:hypothetical protein
MTKEELRNLKAKVYKKYGLSLMKRRESINIDNGINTLVDVENKHSALVSIVHMIDAAVQFMSYKDTLDQLNEYGDFNNGFANMHDATSANPIFNKLIVKITLRMYLR